MLLARRLLLSGMATLVVLVACECALRALSLPRGNIDFQFLGGALDQKDVFESDPELFWRLRPDTEQLLANTVGLRGFLPPEEKQANEVRIACVGDSCTFGAMARYEEAYGMRLERKLQAADPGRRYVTMLAALPGFTTQQDRVLFDSVVAPRRPDVTVFYCGGYNDYVAAVGKSDRERYAATRGLGSLRLVRLISLALEGIAGQRNQKAVRKAFLHGDDALPCRVPLDDFEENMRAMALSARAAGSRIVVIVPPLPESTLTRLPIALRYREKVKELAAEWAVPVLDAPELFDLNAVKEEVDGLPARQAGLWPCFTDWVHPSLLGHELLADGLFTLVEPMVPPAGDGPTTGAASEIELRSIRSASLPAGSRGEIRVKGINLDRLTVEDRVFLGPYWIRDAAVIAGDLVLHTRHDLPPGRYAICVRTATGPITMPDLLELRPPPLQAELERLGERRLRIRASTIARPGWSVQLWLSPRLREHAVMTRYGEFALAASRDGLLPGMPCAPFLFTRLNLPRLSGECGLDGTWSSELEFDLDPADKMFDTVHVQALLLPPPPRRDPSSLLSAVRSLKIR